MSTRCACKCSLVFQTKFCLTHVFWKFLHFAFKTELSQYILEGCRITHFADGHSDSTGIMHYISIWLSFIFLLSAACWDNKFYNLIMHFMKIYFLYIRIRRNLTKSWALDQLKNRIYMLFQLQSVAQSLLITSCQTLWGQAKNWITFSCLFLVLFPYPFICYKYR